MTDVEVVPLPDSADVVVIGAGHNSLVCAAYLARAGLRVLVLEANTTHGGNTRTEELTLPGFAHDSCSSAHVLIQNNPMIRDDELGLVADFGLEYLATDPAVVMPQPDGDVLVMHRDLQDTADELARWSAPDARAFEQLIGEWKGDLAAVHGRWSSHLPQPDDDVSRRYLELRRQSAWAVIHQRFTHPVVRSFMLWLAMATIQNPRRPGTGFLPSSLAAGRLDFGWTTPVGGSQALPDALIRLIEKHGGRVVCSSPVTGIGTGNDGVQTVRVAGGQEVRVGRAVVAGGHIAKLAGMLEGTSPTADLIEARDAWRPGPGRPAVAPAPISSMTCASRGVRLRSDSGHRIDTRSSWRTRQSALGRGPEPIVVPCCSAGQQVSVAGFEAGVVHNALAGRDGQTHRTGGVAGKHGVAHLFLVKSGAVGPSGMLVDPEVVEEPQVFSLRGTGE